MYMFVCLFVCMYVRTYILYVCIVCMYECTYVVVCVCVGGAGADPGLPGPKAYAILETILRKKIQN